MSWVYNTVSHLQDEYEEEAGDVAKMMYDQALRSGEPDFILRRWREVLQRLGEPEKGETG